MTMTTMTMVLTLLMIGNKRSSSLALVRVVGLFPSKTRIYLCRRQVR